VKARLNYESETFELKDWQRRVLSERSELKERLGRLEKFLRSYAVEEGSDEEIGGISYLDLQRCCMHSYLYALDRRIELFD